MTWIHSRTNDRVEQQRQRRTTRNDRITTRIVLTVAEMQDAERILVRAIQSEYFSKEISSLMKWGVFGPNSLHELKRTTSKLSKWNPFLDKFEVVRAGGRYSKAKMLPYDLKFPMILPSAQQDENVRALIRQVHVDNLHCSQIQTYHLTRQRFFILGGLTSIKRVLHCCLPCQKVQKSPSIQKMGDLPVERLETVIPFETVGVDCYGPVYTRHGRGTKKNWVLLCTCFATRAVHLLPLRDMTTNSIIHALTKLVSQYPTVKNLVSDRGTNFMGADKEIRAAREVWLKEGLEDKLSDKNLTWTFGPAHCGHYGGVWERLVGMVKKMAKATVGSEPLHPDVFETMLVGITGIMNRRPLTAATAATTNVDDELVLTPSHFIFPYFPSASSANILPPSTHHRDLLRSSWRTTRDLIDSFWQRFRKEYIPTLGRRGKWTESLQRGPRIGQICLLTDPITPRENWRMVRICDIINEDKLHPRRFIVRDASGTTFDRHIRQLVPLELDADDE